MNTLELMQRFCSDDELRPTMIKPWRCGEYVCASDGHIALMLKSDIEGLPTDGPDVPKIMPDVVQSLPFKAPELRMLVDGIPLVKVMDECPDCDGSGDCECDACGHNHRCDKCHGSGKLPPKEPCEHWDPRAKIEIFGVTFLQPVVRKLLEVAEAADVETIFLVSKVEPMKAMSFKIGDFLCAMMPCRSDYIVGSHVVFNPTQVEA